MSAVTEEATEALQRAQQVACEAAPVDVVERIAAVVNEDVISTSDLAERIRLTQVASGLPDNPEVRRRLEPQVLRTLVNERLQLQEAARLNLQVTPDEIEAALAEIARRNETDRATLERGLEAQGVDFASLRDQIRAQLAAIGCPIKGDVKYGFRRGNRDRSIHLHAWKLEFYHPVSEEKETIVAPLPAEDPVWKSFSS